MILQYKYGTSTPRYFSIYMSASRNLATMHIPKYAQGIPNLDGISVVNEAGDLVYLDYHVNMSGIAPAELEEHEHVSSRRRIKCIQDVSGELILI